MSVYPCRDPESVSLQSGSGISSQNIFFPTITPQSFLTTAEVFDRPHHPAYHCGLGLVP
jgi:hypothetical protein